MGKITFIFASIFLYQFTIKIYEQTELMGSKCGNKENDRYEDGSDYQTNLNSLLTVLTDKASTYEFSSTDVGVVPDKVYGLFQCRQDIDDKVCNECVKEASYTVTKRCSFYSEVIIWYDKCMLRYANRTISGLAETSPQETDGSFHNMKNYEEFAPILADELDSVIVKASSSPSLFAFGKGSVFTYAQCTPDINSASCKSCLETASEETNVCCKKDRFATVFFPSCQLWYDTTGQFTRNDSIRFDKEPGKSSNSSLKPGIIVALLVFISLGLILLTV